MSDIITTTQGALVSSATIHDTMTKVDAHASTLAEQVGKIRVYDQSTCSQASEALNSVQAAAKRLEQLRKGWVGPYNTILKWVNGEVKTRTEKLEYLEDMLKTSLKTYLDEEDRKARAKADQIR